MKKIIFAVFICAMIFACKSTKVEEQPKVTGSTMETTNQPAWVTKGMKADGYHYEVGDGKMSNFTNSKMRAEAAARDRIALWVQTETETALKTFIQDSGMDDVLQSMTFMENVSKQTAKASLRGVEVEDVWSAPDGTIFVLSRIPLASLETALDKNVSAAAKEFERKEQAAFAEFKAKEAFKAAGIE